MGAGAQKSGGAAALPAPPPPRSLYLLATSRFLVEHLHDSGFHLIEISFVVVVFLSRTYLSTEGQEPTLFSGFSPTLSNPGNDVGLE